MVCNCKVGGVQVCEIEGEEALSVYDFLLSATKEVADCIAEHGCWRGHSAYPSGLFGEHACAWLNCRKHMTASMHKKFCEERSLPDHRVSAIACVGILWRVLTGVGLCDRIALWITGAWIWRA